MRLLTLPVTIARVPIELGLGAAKGAVKLAQGLVGGGEEAVEEPRPTPATRRRPARRSTNGSSRTASARSSRSRKGAPRRAAAPAPAATPPSPAATPPSPPAPAGAVSDSIGAVGEAAERAEPAEPANVSEEPELVAESAERGAEDGAGAEVAIDEPWPGYDEMQAADIQDRLVTETAETAAAVSLYEASRKGRADVLEAASRSMTA
jgi:hypothetical protein